MNRSPRRPNVASERSTSLDSRLSCARKMQSGSWQYSNTPSRCRNQLSRVKMNSAQSGRGWRLAPGRVSMRRMEHTRDVLVWSHHLKIVPWHWRESSYRPFEVGHHLSVRTGATQLLLGTTLSLENGVCAMR